MDMIGIHYVLQPLEDTVVPKWALSSTLKRDEREQALDALQPLEDTMIPKWVRSSTPKREARESNNSLQLRAAKQKGVRSINQVKIFPLAIVVVREADRSRLELLILSTSLCSSV